MTEMMSSAVQIERTGGPEVMGLVERADPEPGPGELLVEVAAAGVNFIDTYHRSGLYTLPLPAVLGQEGAGTVLAKGDQTEGFAVGDRVAWWGPGVLMPSGLWCAPRWQSRCPTTSVSKLRPPFRCKE